LLQNSKGKYITFELYIIIMNRSSFANISQTLAKDHRNVDNCIELAQAISPVPIFIPQNREP